MLHEHVGGLGSAYLVILQHFGTLAASKGRIGKDDFLLLGGLNVVQIFGKGIAADDVRSLDPMEYHVHGGDDIG